MSTSLLQSSTCPAVEETTAMQTASSDSRNEDQGRQVRNLSDHNTVFSMRPALDTCERPKFLKFLNFFNFFKFLKFEAFEEFEESREIEILKFLKFEEFAGI